MVVNSVTANSANVGLPTRGRFGRLLASVEWQASLYYWLDHHLYLQPDGGHLAAFELSSGTNLLPPPSIFTEALRTFDSEDYWEINTYTGPLGDDCLREAVTEYENVVNGWSLSQDNIAVTYGAHIGLKSALGAISSPEDATALVLGPQVPLIFQALVESGFCFREMWSSVPGKFVPSADEAIAAVSACHPDLLVLSSPNNPTGTVFSPDELSAICAAAISVGGKVLIDKILSDSALPDFPMPSGTCPQMDEWIQEGTCVVIDSLSKRRAISGLRTGYLLASDALIRRIALSGLGGCPPMLLSGTAAQELQISARLHRGGDDVSSSDRAHADELRQMRVATEQNFAAAKAALSDHWLWDTKDHPGINSVVALRFKHGVTDERQMCVALAEREVSCYPLSTFAASSGLHSSLESEGILELRMSSAVRPERFRETICRTRDALRAG